MNLKNITSAIYTAAPEDAILKCNCTSNAVAVTLYPAIDGKSITVKKVDSGANAVTIYPASGETIDGSSSVTLAAQNGKKTLVCATGGWSVIDSQDETSLYARNHIFYVDGSREDGYTEDGSIARPYKTILAAQTAINALAAVQIALATQEAWDTTRYIVKIAAGIYADDITINNMKYLRYDMEGATISGDVTIATTMVGGPVSDYYGKVEFKGGNANRAYRGRSGLISGDIILTRNNDSLMYLAFIGVEVSGNVSVGTPTADSDGTWVVCLENAYFSGAAKFISVYTAGATCNMLLESYGYNKILAHLALQDGSACNIQLYDCNNTYFDLINITPIENGTVKNCTFNSTTSIVAAKTLSLDANSSLSLFGQSPTLTGITLNAIDGILATAGEIATRAAARALVGDGVAIGTILKAGAAVATTKPNLYVKVLNVPGDTDWERIVTQASD